MKVLISVLEKMDLFLSSQVPTSFVQFTTMKMGPELFLIS